MQIENWGEIPYSESHQKQIQYVQEFLEGKRDETLIFCSHPPVVTLGKKSTLTDVFGWQGDVFEIERGGQATYHGPGQSLCYPIIDLKRRNQDIGAFLEALEGAMIQTLQTYDLNATGNPERGTPDFTGVWVQNRKVASIGIAVKRWVTYHGLALNLYRDEQAFQGINPCGFQTSTMTSVEELLSAKIDRAEFESKLSSNLITLLK